MRIRRWILMSAVLGTSAVACGLASGVVSSYSTTHNYLFSVPGPLPTVSLFNYSVNTRAFEPAPGWDVHNRAGVWAIIGPGGFGTSERAGTDRPTPGFFDAGATASVSANVLNWGGGLYSATMNSSGVAHANFIGNRANASSSLNTMILRAGWNWRAGRFVWRPVIVDQVSGNATAVGNRPRVVRNRDPIMVRGLFPDGSEDPAYVDSFFDVFLEMSGGGTWDDTGFRATDTDGPLDLRLSLVRESPLVLGPPGRLDLQVVDGVVTQSVATGPFSAVGAPPVGTLLGGSLALPSLSNLNDSIFAFDYDLSNWGERDLMFEFSGDGSSDIPEPGTLMLSGMMAALLLRRR